MTPAWRRRLAMACVDVLALAMVGGLGLYLADVQKHSRQSILGEFDARGAAGGGRQR
ncbi:hypothetical protein [Cryptosporangium sp. NPDC048952]|uniref:hypothetical protein n=1 Tax=Cryptosporangium sp. NPDC048952 TaxID=3363961 RepID=UPI00371DC8A5